MSRRAAAAVLLAALAVATPAAAQLAADMQRVYRGQWEGRDRLLRTDLSASPFRVSVTDEGPVIPAGRPPVEGFERGRRITVVALAFGSQSITFTVEPGGGGRRIQVIFDLSAPLGDRFDQAGPFEAAVERVFAPIARLGSPPDDEDETETGDQEDPLGEEPEPPDEEPEEKPEVQLLVQPGRSQLDGDGQDSTTITISARDGEGSILHQLGGDVAVRVSSGRLSADVVRMSGGVARVNLVAPILDDDRQAMKRALQMMSLILQQAQGGIDPQTAIDRAIASGGPDPSVVPGDPWIYIVAEREGVKGRARVEVLPSPADLAAIGGFYRGKDVTGASSWTLETIDYPGTLWAGILRQDGSPDEVLVRSFGDTRKVVEAVFIFDSKEMESLLQIAPEFKGLPTGIMRLPGDSFYMLAPPILFHRARRPGGGGGDDDTEILVEEPRPTVTLVAEPNPVAGDGRSASTLVFTYLDPRGRPVAGVRLRWDVDFKKQWPEGQRGHLARSDAVTGSDGTARAVYVAPDLIADARTMQETGTVKNREVWVHYEAPGNSSWVVGTVGLLRAAGLHLEIEKPGVERQVLPLKVGSLNGTITGRVLLQVQRYRTPGMAATLPLNDAVVRLAGNDELLAQAAVEDGRTDDEGRFTIRMNLTRWPKWSEKLEDPILVKPTPAFVKDQFLCLKYLGTWRADLTLRTTGDFVVRRAQADLAELEFDDAQGLCDKLQLLALMLANLKDTRTDGKVALGSMLDNGTSCLMSIAGLIYSGSKLEKAINEKIKSLESSAGLRKLKAWLTKQQRTHLMGRGSDSLSRRIYNALADYLLKGSNKERNDGWWSGQRLLHGYLREFVIPQVLKQISEALAPYVQQVMDAVKTYAKPILDLIPDIGNGIAEAVLASFDRQGNATLQVMVDSREWQLIHDAYPGKRAALAYHHGRLGREFQRATDMRIGQIYLQAFLDTFHDFTQVVIKISAAVVGPVKGKALLEGAELLDRAKKGLDAAISGAAFFSELYHYFGVVGGTLKLVEEAVEAASGQQVPKVAALGVLRPDQVLQAGPPPLGAGASPGLRLAEAFDWRRLELRDGALRPEALAELGAAEEIVADWRGAMLPELLALQGADSPELAALIEQGDAWQISLDRCRLAALAMIDGPTPEAAMRWQSSAAAFRQATDSLQSALDSTSQAIDALPVAPVAGGGSRMVGWLIALAALLTVAAAAAALLLLRRGRHTAASPPALPRPDVVVPEPPLGVPAGPGPPPMSPPAPPEPRLVDADGVAHVLRTPSTTLGAAADNDIAVAALGVSRHHARLWFEAGEGWWVEDLGSTNGTFVNGERVDRAWLTDGASLALGPWQARFSCDA